MQGRCRQAQSRWLTDQVDGSQKLRRRPGIYVTACLRFATSRARVGAGCRASPSRHATTMGWAGRRLWAREHPGVDCTNVRDLAHQRAGLAPAWPIVPTMLRQGEALVEVGDKLR
ncbi:hypothetical protein TBR22_A47180 [Luteitalea sp. TBR-22]|nr:hypothetical protein TBR22_A47180 [Luteitalea sp. TBR-22]